MLPQACLTCVRYQISFIQREHVHISDVHRSRPSECAASCAFSEENRESSSLRLRGPFRNNPTQRRSGSRLTRVVRGGDKNLGSHEVCVHPTRSGSRPHPTPLFLPCMDQNFLFQKSNPTGSGNSLTTYTRTQCLVLSRFFFVPCRPRMALQPSRSPPCFGLFTLGASHPTFADRDPRTQIGPNIVLC